MGVESATHGILACFTGVIHAIVRPVGVIHANRASPCGMNHPY